MEIVFKVGIALLIAVVYFRYGKEIYLIWKEKKAKKNIKK